MEIKIRDKRLKEKFVVDDAYLNGYAKLCGIYATGVYISLCRHANYVTQECWPEMRTIAEELAISKDSVLRAIKVLEDWNIVKIIKGKDEQGKQKNNIYILTDKSEWKPKNSIRVAVSNTDSRVADSVEPSSCERQSRVAVEGHKELEILNITHKEHTSGATIAPRDDQDIVDIIDAFKIVNPSYGKYFGNTTQREAAARLAKIHGKDKILLVIGILPQTNGRPFFPAITTPLQLEDKWAQLLAKCQQEKIKVEAKRLKYSEYEPITANN
jgi:predicted transcriptional regulator